MKLTNKQLKQLIKEEVQTMMKEQTPFRTEPQHWAMLWQELDEIKNLIRNKP